MTPFFFDSVTFLGGRNIEIIASGSAIAISQAVVSSKSSSEDLEDSIKKPFIRVLISKVKDVRLEALKDLKSIKKNITSKIGYAHSKFIKIIKQRCEIIKIDWLRINDSPHEIVKKLFYSEVEMKGVDFHRPERVRFISVDMRKVGVIGTDFHGVQFYDTDWMQSRLGGRKGLYEEVKLKASGILHKTQNLAQLEQAYRNIRTALEMSKDYDTASDFYVGERECHRSRLHPVNRHFFSIDAWYNAVSRYGTSPFKAIRFLFFLTVLHLSIEIFCHGTELSQIVGLSEKYLTHALEILTLQNPAENGWSIKWLDLVYRFVAAIMIALTALSFRSRIKRH